MPSRGRGASSSADSSGQTDLSRLTVRKWPRSARVALGKGPEITIILPSGTPLRQPTLVAAPRAAMVAFSTVAAAQLANPAQTAVHLPPGAAAPPALQYVVSWIRLACAAEYWCSIIKKPEFRQNVLVYHAALSLGITEAVRTLGGWLTHIVYEWGKRDDEPEATMDMDHVTALLEHVPKEDDVIKALVDVLASMRREGDWPGKTFENQFMEYLAKNPGLVVWMNELDQEVQKANAHTLIYGGNVRNDLLDGSGSANWPVKPAKTNGRGKRRGGRGKGGEEKTRLPGSEFLLDEDEVDKIMGRRG